jgi:hypothetical protein
MSTVNPSRGGSEVNHRRSQRVILSLPVIIRTEEGSKISPFEEETHTIVVNFHGALILLAAKVSKGQKIRLKNRATQEEKVCRVANVGSPAEGKVQIGVEFLEPSPDFWRISFPPEDWVLPEQSPVTSDNS